MAEEVVDADQSMAPPIAIVILAFMMPLSLPAFYLKVQFEAFQLQYQLY